MKKDAARIFLVEDAVKYGTDEAIFLYNIKFWINRNKENKSVYHLKDGRYWTWNTRRDFVQIFPFWTERQLERIGKNLLKQNAILSGNFNRYRYDQTLWYTVNDDSSLHVDSKIVPPNGEIEFTESVDLFQQTVEPIPDVNGKYKSSNVNDSAAEPPTESKAIFSKEKAKEEKLEESSSPMVEMLTEHEMLSLAEFKIFDENDMAFLTNIVDVQIEGLSKKQVIRLKKIRDRALKAKNIDIFRPMDQEKIDERYEIYLKKEKAKLELSAIDDDELYYRYGVRLFDIKPIEGESFASFRKRCEIEIELGKCI